MYADDPQNRITVNRNTANAMNTLSRLHPGYKGKKFAKKNRQRTCQSSHGEQHKRHVAIHGFTSPMRGSAPGGTPICTSSLLETAHRMANQIGDIYDVQYDSRQQSLQHA